jgi:hypothetical protein
VRFFKLSQLLQKRDLLLCVIKEFDEAWISPLIIEEGTEILFEIPALIVQNLALKFMLRVFSKIINELADVFFSKEEWTLLSSFQVPRSASSQLHG